MYVNFLEEEGTGRIREAYPGSTLDRLVGIRTSYDDDILFRYNQNIQPRASYPRLPPSRRGLHTHRALAHACEARDVSPRREYLRGTEIRMRADSCSEASGTPSVSQGSEEYG